MTYEAPRPAEVLESPNGPTVTDQPPEDELHDFLVSWGVLEPSDEQVAQLTIRRHTNQGVDSMLVWTLWPTNGVRLTDYPPLPRNVQVPEAPSGWITVRLPSTSTISERRRAVGLPPTPFLYTLDQVAQMVQVTRETVVKYLHFAGISPGKCPEDKMLTSNLNRQTEAPDWRVADAELIRWLRLKGFKVYDAWSLT